jgi:NAD+ synthase
MNNEKVIETITSGIKEFTDIAVIGLSGGADSTLVATLCKEALGADNVYGYGMPYNDFDKKTFNNRSKKLADKLGIWYQEFSIKEPSKKVIKNLNLHGISNLNKGNIRSRMRMIYLYSICTQLSERFIRRVRVIGTGNLSEDFIGYDTKGGDALADIFPIGELYKSEVYQLLDYYKDKGILADNLIDRIPSAGLEDGQTDEKDLGYTYNEMQSAVGYCLKNYDNMDDIDSYTSVNPVVKFVWNRHKANRHKHSAIPVIKLDKE